MEKLNKKFLAFIKWNKSYCVGEILFIYETKSDSISVYNITQGTFLCTIGSVQELEERLSIRVCRDCGRPMVKGYTDGFYYYHIQEEFVSMMNSLYGMSNWRTATPEESMRHNVSYMYRMLYQ